jgi:hypothetical protein
MSFSGTGTTVFPAADATALILAAAAIQRATATTVLTGLNPGSETFTALYRNQGTGNLSCTWQNRAMVVIPLP